MKKIITLLLVVLLCFSLCACGKGKTLTKEELISTATITTDIMTLQSAVYNNKLKATEDYCNKPIIVSGEVLMVEDNYVVICDSQVCLDAYLPTEDLVKISSNDTITVVGIINDIQDLEMNFGAGMPFNSPHYIMDVGYLVD